MAYLHSILSVLCPHFPIAQPTIGVVSKVRILSLPSLTTQSAKDVYDAAEKSSFLELRNLLVQQQPPAPITFIDEVRHIIATPSASPLAGLLWLACPSRPSRIVVQPCPACA